MLKETDGDKEITRYEGRHKRAYFNLDGISFTVTGNIVAAKSAVLHARALMRQTELVNVNNYEQAWNSMRLNNGTEIKVNINHGIKRASIYAPPPATATQVQRRKKDESFDGIVLGVRLENHGGWLVTSGLNWDGVMAAQIDPKEGQDLCLQRPSRFYQYDNGPTIEQITSLEQIGIYDIKQRVEVSDGYRTETIYTDGTGKALKTHTGLNQHPIDWHTSGTFITEGMNMLTFKLPYAEEVIEIGTGCAGAIVRNQEGYQDDETYLLLYYLSTFTTVREWPYFISETMERILYAETAEGTFELERYIQYGTDEPSWAFKSPSCGIYNYRGRPVYVFSWSFTESTADESVPEFYNLGAIYQNELILSERFEGDHERVSIFDSANVYGKYSNGISFAAQLRTIF